MPVTNESRHEGAQPSHLGRREKGVLHQRVLGQGPTILEAELVQVEVAVAIDLIPYHLLGALVAKVAVGPQAISDHLHFLLVREVMSQKQRVVRGLA